MRMVSIMRAIGSREKDMEKEFMLNLMDLNMKEIGSKISNKEKEKK